MKLAFTIDSMYNSGGMERVLTSIANQLSKEHTIWIITAFQKGIPFFFNLDDKVYTYDLGVESYNVHKRLFRNPIKKDYRNKLENLLMKEHFDVVTSLGGLDLDFLTKIQDGSIKVLWFHFAIDIAKTTWVKGHNLKSKIIANLITFKRIYYAKKYKKIVVLTKSDQEKWCHYCNSSIVIYNPITITTDSIAKCEEKQAIAVGRLDYQKGFDYLIDVWEEVYKHYPNWKLDIFGDGPLKKDLQDRIDSRGLSHVVKLRGVTSKIASEYQNHSIYIMTSRAEGFPLVLIEATTCGLPIVSYDCPFGPNEIIEYNKNGYLISPVGNIEGMASYIIKLISDKNLRQQMGQRSVELSKRFKIENISAIWIEFYNQLIK